MDQINLSPDANGSEQEWTDLTDTEYQVLTAMLSSKTDSEAIKSLPIGKTQYYKYKRRLTPYRNSLFKLAIQKSVEILQRKSVRAAEVITEQLENRDSRIKINAAKDVLDRTVGQPKKQEVIKASITQIGIIGVTQKDLNQLTEPSHEL